MKMRYTNNCRFQFSDVFSIQIHVNFDSEMNRYAGPSFGLMWAVAIQPFVDVVNPM